MIAAGFREFRAAVERFPLTDVALDPTQLEQARASVAASGLLLLGERHGIAETPTVVYALARALGLSGVALEWSHDELGPAVEEFMSRGRFDFDRLWRLPAGAEFFAGDGRITAGHFTLLHRLHDDASLEQVVLFDRLDPVPMTDHWSVRDADMAARLISEWRREVALVAVAGGDHIRLSAPDGKPMAAHVLDSVPHAGRAVLDVEPSSRTAPITFVLPQTSPACVPALRR